MRRKLDIQPPTFDPHSTPRVDPQIITQVREYAVITPLFGGGVEPSKHDPITLIRGTAIRGNLRYWWRACRGGGFQNLNALKDEEDRIWGKAYVKEKTAKDKKPDDKEPIPPVEISVEVTNTGVDLKPYDIGKTKTGKNKPDEARGIPGYASFPLQPDQKELQQPQDKVPVQPVRSNIIFRLTITFHKEVSKDVEAALWAWETFGGVGARTRRGFGALRCINITPGKLDLPQVEIAAALEWLQNKCREHIVDTQKWHKDIPHIPREPALRKHVLLVTRKSAGGPFEVWKDLIDRLKTFRQMRPNPANTRSPGRSRWPEPDAIRHLLLKPDQSPYESAAINPPVYKFPRAAFGLPLPFKFKDPTNSHKKEPGKSVLQPKERDRLTSPLILKPLACANQQTIGLAFILEHIDVRNIALELLPQEGQRTPIQAQAALKPGETFQLVDTKFPRDRENRPTFDATIDQHTDILQVFLEYLGR